MVVSGDTVHELDETALVTLSAPVNATITDASGTGTIVNDDLPPITVSNATIVEGDAGTSLITFTVTLASASALVVSADYSTANGTANSASDYVAASGSLVWNVGDPLAKTVQIEVNGDEQIELSESFNLVLSNVVNATNAAPGTGTIQNGTDIYNLISGSSTINGDLPANILTNRDKITGSAGSDIINGLTGADMMLGLGGDDTYNVDNAGDIVTEQLGEGTDSVITSQAVASYTLGANVENLTTLRVSGGFTGIGNALDNVMTGGNTNDNLSGGDGNDTLLGGGGASSDTLSGGTGNDILDGGTANDNMTGGADDDIYYVDNIADITTEAVGGGTDTVRVTAASHNMQANVENLENVGTGALTAMGNILNNIMTGNVGNDTFNAGGGDDILEGKGGNNTLFGNNGIDTVTYANATAAVTANLLTNTASANGYGGADTFNSVENLIGSALGDTLTGSAVANILSGGAGTDAINGGAGNDIIDGGADNDTITQLSTDGRDFIDGGANLDTYQLNGVVAAETFNIYTRAAFLGIPANAAVVLNPNTEIVVTRNGTGGANIIAELDNIEEITVNTLNTTINSAIPNGVLESGVNGGDTINVFGDFTQTSLDYNTITINGTGATDTVNISDLTSAHRIVFNGNGGFDNVIGTLRPQDVFDGVDSASNAIVADHVFRPMPTGFGVREFAGEFGGILRNDLFSMREFEETRFAMDRFESRAGDFFGMNWTNGMFGSASMLSIATADAIMTQEVDYGLDIAGMNFMSDIVFNWDDFDSDFMFADFGMTAGNLDIDELEQLAPLVHTLDLPTSFEPLETDFGITPLHNFDFDGDHLFDFRLDHSHHLL